MAFRKRAIVDPSRMRVRPNRLGALPLPGRSEPTPRQVARITAGESDDWRWPPNKLQVARDAPGTRVCPRCGAISTRKRWFYDEQRYLQLQQQPDVIWTVCPGCERLDRQIYEGDVSLSGPILRRNKAQALGLIRNAEQQAMAENPIARIAKIQDHGERIAVLTTSAFLARRIGTEFKKAFDGVLDIQRLPREKFLRVRWHRSD